MFELLDGIGDLAQSFDLKMVAKNGDMKIMNDF